MAALSFPFPQQSESTTKLCFETLEALCTRVKDASQVTEISDIHNTMEHIGLALWGCTCCQGVNHDPSIPIVTFSLEQYQLLVRLLSVTVRPVLITVVAATLAVQVLSLSHKHIN